MVLQEQIKELAQSLFDLVLALLNPVILIPIIIITIIIIKKNKEYKSSSYYQITKLSYLSVKRNTGRYGEYLTYKHLKNFEANGAKFLFNVYIPKENGETTEIDVLMLCPQGIFVLESKNYSGWIFGTEDQSKWYQTLPTGRGRSHKEPFYNPVMQNRSHVKHLKAFLNDQIPMHSIIVFSDRCTLKSIQIKSNDVSVIKRSNLYSAVTAICDQFTTHLLTDQDIVNLYDKLYSFSQVDAMTKAQHIRNIHNKLNILPVHETAPSITSDGQASIHAYSSNTTSEPDSFPQNPADAIDPIDETNQVQTIEPVEPHAFESESQEQEVLKCPRCNGNLVLRTATKGANIGKQFYGCSNYPKCKFTQSKE